MRRPFIVARDHATACRTASNLGLRPGFWTQLTDPRQLFGRRGFAVIAGEGHTEHPAWPEIEAEINQHAAIGDEVRLVDVVLARSVSRVRLAALLELDGK